MGRLRGGSANETLTTMASLPDEDDATLVARCRGGERAAWEALVQRYQRLVYAVARRTRLDEESVADVFQTVFARLLEHLPRIRDASRVQAWLVTTAKRESLLHVRRAQRTVSLSRDDDGNDDAMHDVADDGPLPEEALADLQQMHRLRLALDSLDARCRDLLLLLFRDEDDAVPYEEVARRMAMPVGSIGPTRSRCLEKLRGTLK